MEKKAVPRHSDDEIKRATGTTTTMPDLRQKDAVLDVMLRYFTSQGYYLATVIDYEDNREYPYVGRIGKEVDGFIVLKDRIETVAALRAVEATHFADFMSVMTDLLAAHPDIDSGDEWRVAQ